jgi:hypothetical protein
MYDVRVGIEVSDINERITCLCLEKIITDDGAAEGRRTQL